MERVLVEEATLPKRPLGLQFFELDLGWLVLKKLHSTSLPGVDSLDIFAVVTLLAVTTFASGINHGGRCLMLETDF